MKKIALLLAVLLAVSSPAFAKKDAAWVVKKAKVTDDPFEKSKIFTFPEINYRQMGGEVKQYTGVGIMKSPYFLYHIDAKVKTNGNEYVLEVKNPRVNLAGKKAFANYNKALDSDGNELKFALTKQFEPKYGDISHPTPEEAFTITFDEAYIQSHKDTGIVIKVYGENESHIFHVSPWYIEGVLQAIK